MADTAIAVPRTGSAVVRSGWIFSSPATDLLVFALPVVLALIGAFVVRGLSPGTVSSAGFIQLGVTYELIYTLSLDMPHAYATFYRVYVDPAEVRRRRRLY